MAEPRSRLMKVVLVDTNGNPYDTLGNTDTATTYPRSQIQKVVLIDTNGEPYKAA